MIKHGDVEKTRVPDIVVLDRRRQPMTGQIETMKKSLEENGLLTPIGIRIVDEMVVDGRDTCGVPVLVFGATRLAAAKALGWEEIDTAILEGSAIDFQKAEIVENLHRAELTVQQRAEWTAELVRLCEEESASARKAARPFSAPASKVGQVGPVSPGGRGNEGGVRQVARELGRQRTNIRRDLKIASIAPEAKEAARAAGLGDNQSALLKIASEPTPEAQIAKVAEIFESKQTAPPAPTDPAVRHLDALEVAWRNACPRARESFLADIGRPAGSSSMTITPAIEAMRARILKDLSEYFGWRRLRRGKVDQNGYSENLPLVISALRAFDMEALITDLEDWIRTSDMVDAEDAI